MTPRTFANYKEQREIERILLENSTPHADSPSVRILNEGWTRDRIVKTVSPRLNANHIRTVLDALEIKLLDSEPINIDLNRKIENVNARIKMRLDTLEHRLKILEDWKDALEGKSS